MLSLGRSTRSPEPYTQLYLPSEFVNFDCWIQSHSMVCVSLPFSSHYSDVYVALSIRDRSPPQHGPSGTNLPSSLGDYK